MKTNEFIEYMGKNVNRTMKNEQILTSVTKVLEVKKYLPINEKKKLIDKIVYNSSYFKDGMINIDGIDCYIYFTMFTIDAYTNLEIDDVEKCFDALSESAMLPIIIAAIGQEYADVNTLLNLRRDEVLLDNSIEVQFGKFFNNILGCINEFKDDLSNTIGDININKDNIIKFINEFTQQ